MNIVKKREGSTLTIMLEGRLNTNTAPELDQELHTLLNGVTELTFDLGKLNYISSAGLRVLLSAQKQMDKQGSMVIRNANDEIKDIFDSTGFIDFMKFE